MTKYLRIVLTVGCVMSVQLYAKAQPVNDKQYLQKTGELDSIYSEILNESRTFFIQLPASFDPSRKQKYPVAFILDGELLLPTVHDMQNYYSGGFTPEMVLVGISNDKHRIRDLTPSTITSKYGMPFNEENGAADNFSEFLGKELIPYIEHKYPVTKFRTLIGHSYGGLFAIFMLVHHEDIFANYLAIDPSLDWDNQKLLKEAEEILTSRNYDNKALFMSLSGQLHMQNPQITIDNVMQDTTDFTLFARSNIAFSNTVKHNTENGLFFKWKFYPDDIHGTIPFPSIMDGLISLFEWFQMEHTSKFNSFDTPKEELFNIIKYREKKLEEHFGYFEPPYPEELLNMLGYMNMGMQQLEKAKMYFEFAVEYYPESANVYDSMADYYETQGDLASAIKFMAKAFELSGDDGYKEKLERLKLNNN